MVQSPATEELVSSCCYEPITKTHPMNLTCSACGEECDPVLMPCPLDICDGSGEVARTTYDSDSHQYVPDGTDPCPHLDTKDHDPDL